MALRPVQKDFPIDAASAIASIVRAGTEKTNAAKLVQACDDVISWGGYEAFGDPDAAPPKVGDPKFGPARPQGPSAAADTFGTPEEPKVTSLAPSVEPSGLTDEQVIEWLERGGHYTPDGRLCASLIPVIPVVKFALKILLALL